MDEAPYRSLGSGDQLLDVDQVVALEQRIAAQGTSLATLMERAGHALACYVQDSCPEPIPTVVLAGSGNNGGDGWVAAWELAQAGFPVALLSTRHPSRIEAEPARSTIQGILARMEEGDLRFSWYAGDAASDALPTLMGCAKVVVDALLGTGFAHDQVREPAASWIRAANGSSVAILSADIPSGMDAQTGRAASPCIQADTTVTMLAGKAAMGMDEARRLMGHVVLAPLGCRPPQR